MSAKILLCTDMDRTILPNGEQPESPGTRELFRKIISLERIILSYVTGRNKTLIKDAIKNYNLPVPDFAVGDVGASVYRIEKGEWRKMEKWDRIIGEDWHGEGRDTLLKLLSRRQELRLQEEESQSEHKLSFYCDPEIIDKKYIKELEALLKQHGLISTLIWSIDEQKKVGLLDILPGKADKHEAVLFLMRELNLPAQNTVYAGDSGNDLPALTGNFRAVIVKNARQEIKDMAQASHKKKKQEGSLYIAGGDFHGLNGNYSAGVIEGLAHYFPDSIPGIF